MLACLFPFVSSVRICEFLFYLYTVGLFKVVLLLERVIGHNLVVDSVVQLAVVIELVLPIYLPALFCKSEDLFFIQEIVLDQRVHFLEGSILIAHG